MKRVLTGHDEIFGPWIMPRIGGEWLQGRGSTIGLWDDQKGPVAACLYESCNGASVLGNLCGEGRSWMSREFLWFCFYYPFEQLKVNKILGLVDSNNHHAVKLNTHLGFIIEATLKEAAPNGDLLIFSMTKDRCKWLTLKDHKHGKAQSPRTT